MIKKYFRTFLTYYREFNTLSFSIFFLPLLNTIANLFTLKKIIKLIDFNDKEKKIILRANNFITHFRANLFFAKEKEVRFFIDEYLEHNDHFIDVGANIGIFSMYAAIRKNAIVHSFEPEYSNLSLLKENIINNELIKNIFPYSLAVGKNNSITNLHIADITPGAAVSSISNDDISKTDEGFDVIWKEGVMELTLDKICEDLKIKANMIKIDTDGNEKNVLIGGEKTLKDKTLKYVIMEKPSDEKKLDYCYKLLQEYNFKEIKITNERNSFWKKND